MSLIHNLSLPQPEFQELRDLINEYFGIDLSEDKKELIVNRLQPVLRQRGFSSFRSYLDFLKTKPTPDATSELIDRISTNHTYFYREHAHFEYLSKVVLPEWIERIGSGSGEKDLRVWCAAASTGEEPYTLMMLILEAMGREYERWQAGLLATDLSSDVLAKAKLGEYAASAVEKLPVALRDRYFDRVDSERLRVAGRVRKETVFRRFNLIQKRYAFKRPFHVIFCRNVMIYFDADTRKSVVERLYEVTAEEGYLFVGHSESLDRSDCPYHYIAPGVYQRVGQRAR